MSLIAIRARLGRRRRRLLIAVVLVAMLGAVAVHHAAPAMDMHDMDAGLVCMAILAVATAIAITVLSRPTAWRPPRLIAARGVLRVLAPHPAPARAGPTYLALLVIRR